MKNIDVLDYLSSGAIIINNTFKPLSMNKSAEEFLDLKKNHFQKEIYTERFAKLKKILDSVINHNIEFDREEVEIFDAKGEPVTIGLNVNIIKEEEKRYLIIFRNISDIIELKKEIELQKRLAMLGRMAAGVSHELRNPLGAIRGLIELSMIHIKEKNILNNLNLALEEIDSINNIITDVLNFAKPWISKITKVDIHSLINNNIENYLLTNKKNSLVKINIRKNYKKNISPIYIDKEAFKTIFDNIFINAVQAVENQSNSEISITTNIIKNFLFVEIKDNGYGIPSDKLEHVLMPFFSTKFESGTGIGLSITKKIIDTIKGKLYIDSVENQWTSFVFLLPIHKKKDGEKN